MLILSSPFTRDLVFFAALGAIVAVWGLYGFTKAINKEQTKFQRWIGVGIMVAAVIVIVLLGIGALNYTLKCSVGEFISGN